jgi:hypothetical protein
MKNTSALVIYPNYICTVAFSKEKETLHAPSTFHFHAHPKFVMDDFFRRFYQQEKKMMWLLFFTVSYIL